MRSLQQLQQVSLEEAKVWYEDLEVQARRGVWSKGVPSWFEEFAHAVPGAQPALILSVLVPPIIMRAFYEELRLAPEGLERAKEEAREEAYIQAQSEGCDCDWDDDYTNGHDDGYNEGYEDGFSNGYSKAEEGLSSNK